jgi:hypothetical protein
VTNEDFELGHDGLLITCNDERDDHPITEDVSLRYLIGLQFGPGQFKLTPSDNPRKVAILIQYYDNTYVWKPRASHQALVLVGTVTFDLADLSPDFEITQIPICHYGEHRWQFIIKAKKPGAIHAVGTTKELVPPATEDRETAWADSDRLELNFSSQDSAQATAKILSDLIRMSLDIQ